MSNSNAWVKFKLQNAYNIGLISESVANELIELVDRFRPKSNLFVMPGEFDDRFTETLKNIYGYCYSIELEKYAKEKGFDRDIRFVNIPKEDIAVLRARALNNYVSAVTREDYGKKITLTSIAGEDVSGEIYELIQKQESEEAMSEINEATYNFLGVELQEKSSNEAEESEA